MLTPNKQIQQEETTPTAMNGFSRGSSIPLSTHQESPHKKQLSSDCYTKYGDSTASSKKPNMGLLKKAKITSFGSNTEPTANEVHPPSEFCINPTVLNYDSIFVTDAASVKVVPPLPPIREGRQLTLYVDLDETLVHFQTEESQPLNSGRLHTRPFAIEFLEELSKMYELVVFTAGTAEYAQEIVHDLDPTRKWISHVLSREWTQSDSNFSFIKDLSVLGRPLHTVLLVDNCPESFIRQTDNGVLVKSWYSSDQNYDTELLKLVPVLKKVAERFYQGKDADLRTIYAEVIGSAESSSED